MFSLLDKSAAYDEMTAQQKQYGDILMPQQLELTNRVCHSKNTIISVTLIT